MAVSGGRHANTRLHKLDGQIFGAIKRGLALPNDYPLILKVLEHLSLKQQDISLLQASCKDIISLSDRALNTLGSNYIVTLNDLLQCLRNIPDARQLLYDLKKLDDSIFTGDESSVFFSWHPENRELIVVEGRSASFSVNISECYADSVTLSWRRLGSSEILSTNADLSFGCVSKSDNGSYYCTAEVSNLKSDGMIGEPTMTFNLKVKSAPPKVPDHIRPSINITVQVTPEGQGQDNTEWAVQPEPVLSSPTAVDERSLKFAIICCCNQYLHAEMKKLPDAELEGANKLEKHIKILGYRPILLLNPTRSQLVMTVQRLSQQLECDDVGARIMLFLTGHGMSDKNGSPLFAASDCGNGSMIDVNQELVKPLLAGLHKYCGQIVGIYDMCLVQNQESGQSQFSQSPFPGSNYHFLCSTAPGDSAVGSSFGSYAFNAVLQFLNSEEVKTADLHPNSFLNHIADIIKRNVPQQNPFISVFAVNASISDLVLAQKPETVKAFTDEALKSLHCTSAKFALLIGASQYNYSQHSLSDLPFIDKELNSLREALVKLNFSVFVSLNDNAPVIEEIIYEFCNLIMKCNGMYSSVQPLVVIAFDGHGEVGSFGRSTGVNFFYSSTGDRVDVAQVSSMVLSNLAGRGQLLEVYDACRMQSGQQSDLYAHAGMLEAKNYYRLCAAAIFGSATATNDGSFVITQLIKELETQGNYGSKAKLHDLISAVSKEVYRKTVDQQISNVPTQYCPVYFSPTKATLADKRQVCGQDNVEQLRACMQKIWEVSSRRD